MIRKTDVAAFPRGNEERVWAEITFDQNPKAAMTIQPGLIALWQRLTRPMPRHV
jgi:hypothetical protein